MWECALQLEIVGTVACRNSMMWEKSNNEIEYLHDEDYKDYFCLEMRPSAVFPTKYIL